MEGPYTTWPRSSEKPIHTTGRLSFENGTTLRDGRKLLMQTGGSSTSKHPSSLAQGQLMDNRTRRHNMQEAYIKYLAALDETGRMTPPPKIWAEQVAAETMGRYTYGYPPSAWAEQQAERTRTRSSGKGTIGVHPTIAEDFPRHSFAGWGRPVTAPSRTGGGNGGAGAGHIRGAGHSGAQAGRVYFNDGTAAPLPSQRGAFHGTATKHHSHRRTGATYPTAIGPFGDASETLYRGLHMTLDAETIKRTDPWGEAGLGQHAVPGSSTVKLVGSRWRYMAPPVRQWVAY